MREKWLGFLAQWIMRRPWWVIGLSVLLTIISLFTAVSHLTIETDQDNLVSESLEYHGRYKSFLREFGDQEFLYVIIDTSAGLKEAQAFADSVAHHLKGSESITDVASQIDMAPFMKSALLYLSPDEITALGHQLQQPLFRESLSWRSLTDVVTTIRKGMKNASLETSAQSEAYGVFLDHFLQGLAAGKTPTIPNLATGTMPLTPDGYLQSDNGRFLFVTIMPKKDYGTMAVVEKPLIDIRAALAQARIEHPSVTAGLTGRPALQYDEMVTTNRDMNIAVVLSLLGVIGLFIAYFGRPTRPLMAGLALLMGISWTYGFATMAVGYLNLLSIVFAIILVGTGIDFGLHVVSRYREELELHRSVDRAIYKAIVSTGKGNLSSALTTAVAFYSACLTNFLALQELGLIAGTGVLFCWLAMTTVLPAMMILRDRSKSPEKLSTTLRVRLTWLAPLYRHPKAVCAILLIITLFGIPSLRHLTFDHNLLNLQSKGLESVDYEIKMTEEMSESTWVTATLTRDYADIADITARLSALPTVAKVESIDTIIPPNQEERYHLIRQSIAPIVSKLPRRATPTAASPTSLVTELTAMKTDLNTLSEKAFSGGRADAVAELSRLVTLTDDAIATVSSLDPASLTTISQTFLTQMGHHIDQLETMIEPTPIRAESIPATWQSRFISPTGQYAVYASPKGNLWDPVFLETFVTDIRSVDPTAVGNAIEVFESSHLMQTSFVDVAIYAIIAIIVIVWIDFRSWRHMLLAILPLTIGMTWLLMAMGIFHIPFNLANFFSIPILLGIGVDNGIQIMHRYREDKNASTVMTTGTGAAVILTSLTTWMSFVMMTIAHHRGILSLGLIMSIGTLTCLMASLFLLPSVLTLIEKKRR